MFLGGICSAQDTVRVQVNVNVCHDYMPNRYWIASASKPIPGVADSSYKYLDSIRVCNIIINKPYQRYYLIVTDSSGRKMLEGNFFDRYADGHVITYDQKGRKFSEGDYKIERIRSSKHKTSVQTGIWYYYDVKGNRIRSKKYD